MDNAVKKEVIAVRVTSEQKEHIKELARLEGLTLTDYVLNAVLPDKDQEAEISNQEKDLLQLEEIHNRELTKIKEAYNQTKEQMEHDKTALDKLKNEVQRLEGLIEVKKEAIKSKEEQAKVSIQSKEEIIEGLKDQLQQANKRIDDYSRQLEQQQSLQLATVSRNEELQRKIELIEDTRENKERKGFWARLFSGS